MKCVAGDVFSDGKGAIQATSDVRGINWQSILAADGASSCVNSHS